MQVNDLFYSDNKAEDLLRLADVITAVGNVISFIGWKRDESYDYLVGNEIETLGLIVSEFSRAMSSALDESHHVLYRFFRDGDVSFLLNLQNKIEELNKTGMSPETNLYTIGNSLNEIDLFLKKDVTKIMDIKRELENRRGVLKKKLASSPGNQAAEAILNAKAVNS